MAEQQAPEGKRNFEINMVQVLDLGCGLLHQAFIAQPADKAKALLKQLKNGKRINMGTLTLTKKTEDGTVVDELPLPLSLELDYSEFKGGFNYPAFDVAIKSLLHEIATTVRAKKDLNIMTNQETGGSLVHRPGIIQTGEQINVLVISFEPGKKEDMILRLMFLEPSQYDEYRKGNA